MTQNYIFIFLFILVTATCEQEVFNNITYIVSPSFPALMSNDVKSCKLKIKMISPDISQLRLDFVHFAIVSIWIKLYIFPYSYCNKPIKKKKNVIRKNIDLPLQPAHKIYVSDTKIAK